MGNLCSKSKNPPESDAFSTPGRVLGSGPNPNPNSNAPRPPPAQSSAPRAPLPSNTKLNSGLGSGTAGRTVADRDTTSTDGDVGGGGKVDPRMNAALAAQKRAELASTATKGKLGSKLAAQKAQTQTQTLNEASRDEIAARDADGAAQARAWQ
ncbi:hypothetical protein BO70DRAFT_362345 [Aspergillus heteromorphus CBS 117.55]|uniref:Uncharacterized protein n=1 Tax=Aspergillus heteromorphus CBS 117.55 TaxID=1448321 RepID=A0A317W9I3_9EURO|nr:uncharacterized protein BO70DRAFT_362345 [Aspergillus heteromorphus CBS 117.55]PWY81912.1 hypothetical protein BO70DRAFT_362345 [Aspergillus heteromorphus CBS 117.55]